MKHKSLPCYVILLASVFWLAGCVTVPPAVEDVATVEVAPVVPVVQACKNSIEGYIIVGEAEYVAIEPENIRLKARIDTGARTTSLGVAKLERYERDGKRWVRFSVETGDGTLKEFKRQIVRVAKIKRHNAESVERVVVKLALHIGESHDVVEVTLADREQYEYPFLVGRNYLQGRALVNVNRKFVMLSEEL
jgi:hypothetical protein